MKKHWMIIVILAVSIIVHFAYFSYPAQTVFDEVHFGRFASGYFTHQYFFDIHPPLGKLLISAAGYIGGFEPGFSFSSIGSTFPDQTYLWLRLLPRFAGTLLPLVIFFLCLRLKLGRWASFTAALLVALDNALLAQSRFILLDAFLLLFGFLAILMYLRYRQDSGHWYNLLLAALLGGAALSVKWTGATFLAVIVFCELYYLYKNRSYREAFSIAQLILIPLVFYYGVFAVHFALLDKTGDGNAFMSSSFRKTLAGSPESSDATVKPLSLYRKFIELNAVMYSANAGLRATHPYSSLLMEWPLMIGFVKSDAGTVHKPPIFYWSGPSDTQLDPSTGKNVSYARRIYLIGNPVIWWGSSIAMLYLVVDLLVAVPSMIVSRTVRWRQKFALLLMGFYLFNLLPFFGVKRILFLYHYFAALIVAIVALVFLVHSLQHAKKIYIAIIALATVGFLWFAPLTYGLPMSDRQYKLRAWFPSWDRPYTPKTSVQK